MFQALRSLLYGKSLADSVFLVNYVVEAEVYISETIFVYHLRSRGTDERKICLKFVYAGNTQYHVMNSDEAELVGFSIGSFLNKLAPDAHDPPS